MKTKKGTLQNRILAALLCILLAAGGSGRPVRAEEQAGAHRAPAASGYVNAGTDFSPIDILTDREPEETVKKYTIMVYMMGSTLEYNSYYGPVGSASIDIFEMLCADTDYSNVNVLVFTGGAVGWLADIPNDRNCVLDLSLYRGDSFTDMIVASTLENENMGEAGTLAGFINYCESYYPAEHYGLICWDHGGGPIYGYGDDPLFNDDGLELDEMQAAMEMTPFSGGRRLDWIGFDACLMGTLEVANIWVPYADYLVASEEYEVADGWDYSFLSAVGRDSSTEQMLEFIVDVCGNSMASGEEDSTLSCLKLDKIPALVDAVDDFFAYATSGLVGSQASAISKARQMTKEFGVATSIFDVDYELVDIGNLADNFRGLYSVSSGMLKRSVEAAVLCQFANVSGAGGVCMYYPSDEMFIHILYLGDFYDRVNPSENYRSFLRASSDLMLTGETTVAAPFADLEAALAAAEAAEKEKEEEQAAEERQEEQDEAAPEPEETESVPEESPVSPLEVYGEDDILLQLTEEQEANFSSAYYTILQYSGENSLTPYVMYVPLIPDDEGLLHVPSDPDILCLTTDEITGPIPWRVRFGEKTEERTTYKAVATALSSGPDFDDFSSMMPITVNLSDERDSGNVTIQSIQPASETGESAGKTGIDITEWEGILGSISGFTPAEKSEGVLLPFDEWTPDGKIRWKSAALDESFGFAVRKTSELPEEFAAQIVVTDIYGSCFTSGLLELAEKKRLDTAETETEKGILSFRIMNGEAVLTGYEGTDEVLRIPGSAGGYPVTEIGSEALKGSQAGTLILPEGIRKIGDSALSGCRNLESVEFPSTLREIGYAAFRNDSALTGAELPEGLTRIGKAAFAGCSSLKSVDLPAGLEVMKTAVFAYCTSLETIRTGDGCEACRSDGKLLFSADGKTLLAAAAAGADSIVIPEGTERIGYGTFAGCRSLEEIGIPETVTVIENYAFYECFGLKSLTLPENLESIGASAFGKSILGYYRTGNTLAGINSIRIGPNVSHIGTDAFDGIGAKEIIADGENEKYGSRSGFLTNKGGDFILECPGGLGAVIEIPEGTVGLAEELFRYYGSEAITDVYMPDSLTYIPNSIFSSGWDDDFCKVYHMTIHGSRGSAAEAYAEANGIAFQVR